jgi:hypothetical protein
MQKKMLFSPQPKEIKGPFPYMGKKTVFEKEFSVL